MGRTIEFNTESFPLLTLRDDFEAMWNPVGLDELEPREQQPLAVFLQQLNYDQFSEFNANDVLLVKAENGVLRAVYGPAIWRDGEQIILRIGSNNFPVQQKDDKLEVGQLRGKLVVAEEETLDGEKYPVMSVSFVSKTRDVYIIPIKLATKDLGLTVADVTAAIVNEEPILPLLSPVPTPAIKMQELGIGEYPLHPYISQSDGEYGTIYKLHLIDGPAVLARGNVKILLDSGWRPHSEKPLLLIISKVEKLGENKFSVDCALRERLPVLNGANGNGHHHTVDILAEPADPESAESELEPEGVSDLDQIPF